MATQFYSIKDTAAKLGKTEDEVKALVRDGKLREFRDRGQLFFKADEVDRLAGSPPSLPTPELSRAGESYAGGSKIGGTALGEDILSDTSIGASQAGAPAVPKSRTGSTAGGLKLPEDTALGLLGSGEGSAVGLSPVAPKGKSGSTAGGIPLADETDLGLSTGLGGLKSDSVGEPKAKGDSGKTDLGLSGADMLTLDELEEAAGPAGRAGGKEDTVISSVGISVFDEDEIQIDVDPLGKTQVAPSMEDQISLEGVGSGSGLLDLTRESDDTSLGAELLDEIYPGEEASTVQEDMPTEVVPGMGVPSQGAAPAFAGAPQGQWVPMGVAAATVVHDPMVGWLVGVMVIGILMLGLAGMVLAGAIQGVVPSFLLSIYGQWVIMTAGTMGLAIAICVVGWLMGKSSTGKKPARAAAAEAAPSEKSAEKKK